MQQFYSRTRFVAGKAKNRFRGGGKKKKRKWIALFSIILVCIFFIFTLPPFTSRLNTPGIVCSMKLWGTNGGLYVTFALRPRTPDRTLARKIPASECNYVIGEKRSFLVAPAANKIRHCSAIFPQFSSCCTIDDYYDPNVSTERISAFFLCAYTYRR